jgi:hypothetical protein
MISKEDLESCVVYIFKSETLFEWFINQDISPFGLSSSDYSELYQSFIKKVIDLYEIERKDTFFFSGGKLINHDKSKAIISINNFKIDVNKLNSVIRDKKLEIILNT